MKIFLTAFTCRHFMTFFMQAILILLATFCCFVFSRPLPPETSKECDFHKYENKQASANFPDISKSKVQKCQGTSKTLLELEANAVSEKLYGADNLTQLLTSRIGMYPVDFRGAGNMKMCDAHYAELYSNFDGSGHVLKKQKSNSRGTETACSYAGKHQGSKVPAKARLSFEESQAIYDQNNKLVIQAGIPICKTEKTFATQQLDTWKRNHPASLPPRKAVQIPKDSYSGADDNANDPDYCIPSGASKRDTKCDALAKFAQAIGMSRVTSKSVLSKMVPDTRRKKYNLGHNLYDQMCEVMAGEEKQDLKEHICQRVLNYHPHKETDLNLFLQNMSQLYLETSDKLAKRHYLSYIVGIIEYSKISKYLPNISRYHYDQAIKYALANPAVNRETYKRERFNAQKVDLFVDFISSDIVVTGLPFGTRTLQLSTSKLDIPSTLRLQKHTEIIDMYIAYMEQRGLSHLVLPRSTMYHLLNVCTAKRTTQITCVDYFISNAVDGMNDINLLLDKWLKTGTITLHENKIIKHHVLESMQYLRTQYLVNVNEISTTPSHCAKHSLSSATDTRLQATENDHVHDGFCERCLKLVRTMDRVLHLAKLQKENIETDETVDQQKLREVEEDILATENAIESIKKLQEHFLKSVYSDEFRKYIIENVIDEQTALVTIDFAQKYLVDYYKQTQEHYFARRGMSWEVSHVFIRKNGELMEHTFIHLIENEKQDSKTVLAILKDVLIKLKQQNILKVVARSDNAGCYHCKEVLMSLKHVIEETGVQIIRWSFSEPQSGKSSADRKAATVKKRLRAYLDKKNNIESEADMFKALTTPNTLKHMTITRATVDSSASVAPPRGSKTFPAVKHYFDFEISPTYVKGRHAHNIGSGHNILFKDFNFLVQKNKLNVLATSTSENFWNNINKPAKAENEDGLFACLEEACVATFVKKEDMDSHMDIGIHDIPKETQADHAMKRFKKRLEEMVTDQKALSNANGVNAALSQYGGSSDLLAHFPRGWALREEKKPAKRFTDDQKLFMTELYERGVRNSKDKVRPEEAETMMKAAKVNGKPRFTVLELLNKKQIKSFFGQLGRKKKDRTTQQEREIEELRNAVLEEARRILPAEA